MSSYVITGADHSVVDWTGQTILHRACFGGHDNLVDFLIEKGASHTYHYIFVKLQNIIIKYNNCKTYIISFPYLDSSLCFSPTCT